MGILNRVVHPQFVVVKKKKDPSSSSDKRRMCKAALFSVGCMAAGALMGPGEMFASGVAGIAFSTIFCPKNSNTADKFIIAIIASTTVSFLSFVGVGCYVTAKEERDIPLHVRTNLLDEIKKGKTEVFGSVACEAPGLWAWNKKDIQKEISISVSPKTNVPPDAIGILEEIMFISRVTTDKKTRHKKYNIPVDTNVKAAIFEKLANDTKQVRVYDK